MKMVKCDFHSASLAPDALLNELAKQLQPTVRLSPVVELVRFPQNTNGIADSQAKNQAACHHVD
jgi:hypothetical protein